MVWWGEGYQPLWQLCVSYQRCRPGHGKGNAQGAAHCRKVCGQITESWTGLPTLLPFVLTPKGSKGPLIPSLVGMAGPRDWRRAIDSTQKFAGLGNI